MESKDVGVVTPDLFTNWTVQLVARLPKDELTQRIAVAVRAGESCQRAVAFYLHDMEVRRVHYELGYASAVQFAMNRLGMSKGRARELLRTGRRLEDLVQLDAAFAHGELSWSKSAGSRASRPRTPRRNGSSAAATCPPPRSRR